MASLRHVATCIGVNVSPLSVRRNFFGCNTTAATLSLLTQVRRLTGRHVHINVIRVGSEQFTTNDEREIDLAIQYTRDTYAQAGMGVARVVHFAISTADANGRDVINNNGEASALTDEWTVPNDALDVFCVRRYVGEDAGLSPADGPCDKDAKGMDGSVIEMDAGGGISDVALAHEVGHYLGLVHFGSKDDPLDSPNRQRLMHPNGPIDPNTAVITGIEGANMRDHCFCKPGC